jgi:hypothetical protein
MGLPTILAEYVGISTTSTDFLAFFLALGFGDSFVMPIEPAITAATSDDRFLRLAAGFGVTGLADVGGSRSCCTLTPTLFDLVLLLDDTAETNESFEISKGSFPWSGRGEADADDLPADNLAERLNELPVDPVVGGVSSFLIVCDAAATSWEAPTGSYIEVKKRS